jgi:hypothetical protein
LGLKLWDNISLKINLNSFSFTKEIIGESLI